jgi:hypothetical protein
VEGGEDGFGLGVAVGLPGEHGEVVGGEAVVVEAFAGKVVIDGAVGGFGGGPERSLDVGEDGVGFGEGAEVFGPVVAGEFGVCGLVEADADVSVGLAGGVFDFVLGASFAMVDALRGVHRGGPSSGASSELLITGDTRRELTSWVPGAPSRPPMCGARWSKVRWLRRRDRPRRWCGLRGSAALRIEGGVFSMLRYQLPCRVA